MRALRHDGTGVRLVSDAPEPKPGPGEALVRPRLMGIGAADLDVASGRVRFQGTLGREFVGTVVDVNLPKDAGPALQARAKLKGQRVVGDANIVCGKCELCRAGLKSHCRTRTVLGSAGRDGCLAELFTIPLMNLLPVPEHLDDDHAVFAEPLAAAAHSAQMFKVEGKPYITVLGDGRLGLLTVQVMARLNASVRLLGKHPEKFGLCERWSIKHRHIDEVGRRQDQDVVVDCTGSASGLELAMQLVRPRGKIVLKSLPGHQPVPPGSPVRAPAHPAWKNPVDLSPLVVNEVDLIGCRCGPIELALGMLERHEVQVLPLITKRAKLADAGAILDWARSGQIKVLIEP